MEARRLEMVRTEEVESLLSPVVDSVEIPLRT